MRTLFLKIRRWDLGDRLYAGLILCIAIALSCAFALACLIATDKI